MRTITPQREFRGLRVIPAGDEPIDVYQSQGFRYFVVSQKRWEDTWNAMQPVDRHRERESPMARLGCMSLNLGNNTFLLVDHPSIRLQLAALEIVDRAGEGQGEPRPDNV